MQYNFTDRVRLVIAAARNEAVRLRHDYVGTEHLLLGLLREQGGVAGAALDRAKVDRAHVCELVEQSIRKGRTAVRGELPYTSRAKKSLEYAMLTAREFGHTYVGTEHLLIGLLRVEEGIAAQVLERVGFALDDTVELVRKLLNKDDIDEVPAVAHGVQRAAARASSFRVIVDDGSSLSIYEQIIAQVQEAVAVGMVQPGDKLQPVRQLADALDIAPGTVARAYSELEGRGVVVTEGARGTRIAPRTEAQSPSNERVQELTELLRPVAVAAFHLGASADSLKAALDSAMTGIFDGSSS